MNITETKILPVKVENPKISIGIPVYNGEKFLPSTIKSVLEQTFKDFEVIISDNNSTDNTKNICREFEIKDSRVRYMRQITNIGGYNNYKIVLDNSFGKYFMWIAADDILGNKDYLKILNYEITKEYDYYFPEVSLINEKGNIIRTKAMQSFKNCETQVDFLEASLKENGMHLYSLFLKKNLVEDWKYLEKCKSLSTCNEGLFVLAINATRRGKFVNKAIKLYRHHKDSWSQSTSPKNLIISQTIYASRSIFFILQLKKLNFFKKIFFSTKIFFSSSKVLSYSVLYVIWDIFGLYKFPIIKKIIKKLIK